MGHWAAQKNTRFLLFYSARLPVPGSNFIGNPNQLPVGENLCVPAITEATRLRNRFLNYLEAVRDMALPEPSEISDDLTPITTGKKSVVAVSWVRSDQVKRFPVNQTIKAGGEIWVTLAPKLKEFCTDYAKTRGSDLAAITLRLEQRIGLPPHSAKTNFVELEVEEPTNPAQIFRPCASWAVTTKTCDLGPPKKPDVSDMTPAEEKKALEDFQQRYAFFTGQYYGSFGTAQPAQFPWTSLGYTFDWAYEPVGLGQTAQFVQYGESEYVIPTGASITVKGIYTTAEYCGIK